MDRPEHEQVRPSVAGEAPLVGAIRSPAGEMREHLRGVDEQDLVAAAARFVGQGLRQVALADPGDVAEVDALRQGLGPDARLEAVLITEMEQPGYGHRGEGSAVRSRGVPGAPDAGGKGPWPPMESTCW